MNELIVDGWSDYELLDSGDGQRLERFGSHTLVRPDPNVIWSPTQPEHKGWQQPDLRYVGRENKSGWTGDTDLLNGWNITYNKALFHIQPSPFRHVGLFPEQAGHWQWIEGLASKSKQKLNVLNLFAYTGASSIVAAQAGMQVTHVDASKATIYKAKENAVASGLDDQAIRWIVDDAIKFMKREVRRGQTYDLIMMDPPVFGRGPKGEIWRLEEGLLELAELAGQLLSKKAVGLLVNIYATSLYPQSALRVVEGAASDLQLELGTLSLRETLSKKVLPTGFFIRSK